jgi:hypothetical protein
MFRGARIFYAPLGQYPADHLLNQLNFGFVLRGTADKLSDRISTIIENALSACLYS